MSHSSDSDIANSHSSDQSLDKLAQQKAQKERAAVEHAQTLNLLAKLPHSYSADRHTRQALPAPYGLLGLGEGSLAAQLLQSLIGNSFTRTGTQFVLFSPDAEAEANVYAELAEVAGASVCGISTGKNTDSVISTAALIPSGALSTYHYLQYVAYATGKVAEAEAAEALLSQVAASCDPQRQDDNPARQLAWQLWDRVPLLLASTDAEALPVAWQALLARIGKSLSIAALGDPLPLVTGAFEAQHEKGDGRLAIILGDSDSRLQLAREVLESRIDEVVHLPYLTLENAVDSETTPLYAQQLAMWYLGAWVAAYLAERYQQSAGDPPMLAKVQQELANSD